MIPARPIILRSVPAPSFARDFAATKALNNGVGPAISFSRGSNATYFDGTGTLQYADNNGIRNSEGIGAVAGTPGTVPTNWSAATPNSGLSRQIVGTGTANGFNYIDIRYSGTTTANSGVGILFESTTGIVSFMGQTGNTSVSLSVVAGSVSNLGRVGITVQEWAGGSNVATARGSDLRGSLTSTLQRFNYTTTFSNATTTNSIPLVEISFSTGIVVDFTLRISAPQYQVGVSSPTAYKPTTGNAYYGPRFDSDPVTKQSKGLLIEEARTNLLTYSNILNGGSWAIYNSGTVGSKTLNYGTAPDGTVSSTLFSKDSTTGPAQLYVNLATTSTIGSVFTYSCFIKSSTSTSPTNETYLGQTGATQATAGSVTVVNVGNGWYRHSKQYTTTATNATIGVAISLAGTGAQSIEVWGAQLELGTFPTSYIPTGASTATRSADVAQITGNDFKSFYNQYAGTCVVAGNRKLPAGAAPTAPRMVDMIGNILILIRGGQMNPQVGATPSGTIYNQILGPSYAEDGSTIKGAFCYSFSSGNGASNGIVGNSISSGTLNTSINTLTIGDNGIGTRCFEGCISSIAYYPMRLSDQWLYKLTA
jgi:hypothetical protein